MGTLNLELLGKSYVQTASFSMSLDFSLFSFLWRRSWQISREVCLYTNPDYMHYPRNFSPICRLDIDIWDFLQNIAHKFCVLYIYNLQLLWEVIKTKKTVHPNNVSKSPVRKFRLKNRPIVYSLPLASSALTLILYGQYHWNLREPLVIVRMELFFLVLFKN
jgi:hypothetical protein